MAIDITCPGCLKRFQVSDQFAGRSGPCPGCKTVIKIPEIDEQIIIHEPEHSPDAIGVDAKIDGIARRASFFGRFELITISVLLVLSIIIAVIIRAVWSQDPDLNLVHGMVLAMGGLLTSFVSAYGGYGVLKESEIESFPRKHTLLRSTLAAGAYFLLASAFVLMSVIGVPDGERLLPIAVMGVSCIAIASFVPMVLFEMEFLQGLFHVAIFVSMATLLSLLAGNLNQWLF